MSAISIEQAEQLLRERMPPWVLELNLSVRELSETSAILALPFDAKLHRHGGMVSGQALMAMADTAMVILLFSAVGVARPIATVDMHTTFMRPAVNAGVLAEATVLRLGRSMAFCQVRLVMDTAERQLVANVVGSYATPTP